ncbi:uncharacterized protein LOC133202715 [Saccostrea echinata]|uniref:uncharacterized protein LOC133202715 n=1 Tax=Saccostrea echinata TaxID=191078 RepID=UPI002A7EAE93|nr:uncharacterized protein LOC133202715 [Saccostrea echinata]
MDLVLCIPVLVMLYLGNVIPMTASVRMWDRATVVCDTNSKKHVVEENSDRVVNLDANCQSGEIAWRYSTTYVYLKFRKPSPFKVCFRSNAIPGMEKYSVYKMDGSPTYAGSPNRDRDICVMSSGLNLDIALEALDTFYVLTANFKVNCV